MENIVIAGFGEIGQSLCKLYNPKYHRIFAIDPHIHNILLNIYNINIRFKGLKGTTLVPLEVIFRNTSSTHLEYGIPYLEVPKGTSTTVLPSKASESIDSYILNISYGYSKRFEEITKGYIKQINPKLVIIHSTVPIGTCRRIAEATSVRVAHSPVLGKHPNLAESILTFKKAVSGIDEETTELARKHLESLGITTVAFKKLENTEAAKMLCTSYYAHCIDWMRDVKAFCDKQRLDFDEVYKAFNENYNEGYGKMGLGHFRRPVLEFTQGHYGGHCLLPNLKLLKKDFKQAKVLLRKDRKFASLQKHGTTNSQDGSRNA